MHLIKVGANLLDTASKFALFSVVRFERRKVDKKCKPTWKLKYANSILEYFEYFGQKSSRSVLIILSCTVSKCIFSETQCSLSSLCCTFSCFGPPYRRGILTYKIDEMAVRNVNTRNDVNRASASTVKQKSCVRQGQRTQGCPSRHQAKALWTIQL